MKSVQQTQINRLSIFGEQLNRNNIAVTSFVSTMSIDTLKKIKISRISAWKMVWEMTLLLEFQCVVRICKQKTIENRQNTSTVQELYRKL